MDHVFKRNLHFSVNYSGICGTFNDYNSYVSTKVNSYVSVMHDYFRSGRLKLGGNPCPVKPKYSQWQPSDICLYIHLLRTWTP